MAQRVQVNLIDDLNGEDAQETVRFDVDGINYAYNFDEKPIYSFEVSTRDYELIHRLSVITRGHVCLPSQAAGRASCARTADVATDGPNTVRGLCAP
jgi:hypothetical protein